MRTYSAYWKDDPTFDAAHRARAVPDLPPPALNESALRRLCGFALEHNFTWAPKRDRRADASPRCYVERVLGAARWNAPEGGFGLSVSGAGGGQWTIAAAGNALHVGLPSEGAAVIYLSSQTLSLLIGRQLDTASARSNGQLALEGGSTTDRETAIETLTGMLQVG